MQYLALPDMILKLEMETLTYRPFHDKWSIKDYIAHLVKYQLVFLDRMKMILNEESPLIKPYKAEEDILFPEYQQRELLSLLETMRKDRIELIEFIKGLKKNDVSRVGIHGNYGILTITEWTEFFLLHEAHHIFAIFKLTRAKLNLEI